MAIRRQRRIRQAAEPIPQAPQVTRWQVEATGRELEVFFSSPQVVILQIETTERTPQALPRTPQTIILQIETTE